MTRVEGYAAFVAGNYVNNVMFKGFLPARFLLE